MNKSLKTALTILAVIGFFSFASQMDYQDEVNEQAHYCKMVEMDLWPEFKKNVSCDNSIKVEGK